MSRALHLLACWLICVNCFSQQIPFVHYTPKDGLINSRVRKSYQDSKGRMYFLTYGGLSMYDGARFRNYTRKEGLPNEVINDIIEVGPDSLLVACNAPFLKALVRGKIIDVKTVGIDCPVINHFYWHDNKKLYLSSDVGLFVMEQNNIHELDISFITDKTGSRPNVASVTGWGNHLLITTNEMNPRSFIYLYDIAKNKIIDATAEEYVHLIGKDHKQSIWLSHRNRLYLLDEFSRDQGKLRMKDPPSHYNEHAGFSIINSAPGKEGIWLVYSDGNLNNKEIRYIDEKRSNATIPIPGRASSSGIHSIFVDRENTIWLGIDGEGVFKLLNSPLKIFQNPITPLTRIDRSYYSDGITWFNSSWANTSLGKFFKRQDTIITTYNSNTKQTPIIAYADSTKLLATDWYHVYEGRVNEKNKSIHFTPLISIAEPDAFGGFHRVDPYGNLLLHQRSSFRVWSNGKYIDSIPVNNPDFVDGLSFDNKQRLWLVHRYSGIYIYEIQPHDTPYLKRLFHFSGKDLAASSRCFTLDKNGLVWVGTRDLGLFAYEFIEDKLKKTARLKKIFHFDVSSGLTDNFVTAITCDSANNIIVGTQTGLDRLLRISTGTYKIETLSRNSNFFAFIKQVWAEKEYAYALTNSGVLLQISTLPEPVRPVQPDLLLEEMKVNGKAMSDLKDNFRHTENTLSFLVAAPSFFDEKQISYAYLLEGSGNSHWSDTSTNNSVINLTSLSASNYTLKVKAFFPSNTYAPSELSYAFRIHPPWWQTWWFRITALSLVLMFLFFSVRFYFRKKMEKEKAILERQKLIEKERTRIATDMHDDLGAGLSRIKFLSETIGIKKQQDQPFEEDISKIKEYSHEMIDKMGEIVWALNEKHDTLSDLLSYTRSYAVSYLGQNGIQCLMKSPGQLAYKFISGEFRRNIFLTVKEALHNIVKHAEASTVNFQIVAGKELFISIMDNGKGFDKTKTRAFSNGLANMQQRIAELGGHFEILSDNGTQIRITVPV